MTVHGGGRFGQNSNTCTNSEVPNCSKWPGIMSVGVTIGKQNNLTWLKGYN